MPASPFPGMDPYIEWLDCWPDFHQEFMGHIRAQLNQRLPRGYLATLNERIALLDPVDFTRRPRGIGPDVTVLHEARSKRTRPQVSPGPVVTLEPLTLPNDIELYDLPKQTFVEVRRVSDQRVVTDIELLSPSNKRASGRDRVAYLAKRRDLVLHEINVVELDLLLGGARAPMPEPLPSGDFYCFITCAPSWDLTEVYSWKLRDPLPTLPIPLREDDASVAVDLAAAFVQTYERGRYDELLRYIDPPARLAKADRAWIMERIADYRK